ncbi:UvrD-helicase domain-containing protein [Clostridium botulinum]|nr:UvrD-helicase domain-containing protein [Clostridium botulinum]
MHLDVISGLNDAQREAVTTTEGYIRVIAGAGSGKTKALTSRYIYLVHELGISTANILCATFTNKAAREMKKRIRTMIGDNDTGLIGTFHGFCRRLLKEDIYTINYPDNFIVMDNEDMDLVLRIVYEDANISSKQFTFSKAKDMISKRKIRILNIYHI